MKKQLLWVLSVAMITSCSLPPSVIAKATEQEVVNAAAEAVDERGVAGPETNESIPEEWESLSEIVDSGECGDSLNWKLEQGVLTISGQGTVEGDYSDEIAESGCNPWAKYCDQIVEVVFAEGIGSIGINAFNSEWYDEEGEKHPQYNKLEKVTFSDSITSIQSNAFNGCKALHTIVLNEGLKTIEGGAFSETNLTEITIPSTVINMSTRDAFFACKNLVNINVEENNETFSSIDGVLYNKEKTKLLRFPEGKKDSEFETPAGVVGIDQYAFRECENLTSIILSFDCTEIGPWAFLFCKNISSVIVKSCALQGGYEAFTSRPEVKIINYPGASTQALCSGSYVARSQHLPFGLARQDQKRGMEASLSLFLHIIKYA